MFLRSVLQQKFLRKSDQSMSSFPPNSPRQPPAGVQTDPTVFTTTSLPVCTCSGAPDNQAPLRPAQITDQNCAHEIFHKPF
jgi:hypothetical protein